MSDRVRGWLLGLAVVVLFGAGVLLGAWSAWNVAGEHEPEKIRSETEIHHEPTIIENTYNRTLPIKETTVFKDRPCECSGGDDGEGDGETTLPETGGPK